MLFFFFKDPPTTEIYSYSHPLSLHDALPISRPERCRCGCNCWRSIRRHVPTPTPATPAAVGRARTRSRDARWRCSTRATNGRRRRWSATARSRWASTSGATTSMRSEEHTSELQSLMRISYAVFCLKKKKNRHPHTPVIYIKQPTPILVTRYNHYHIAYIV